MTHPVKDEDEEDPDTMRSASQKIKPFKCANCDSSFSHNTVLNFPPKCDIESENDQNFVLNKKVNISKLEVYTKTIE